MKFTRKTIKQAFDANIEDLFDEFEEKPVASGSIGQVYRARLSTKGARNTGIDAGVPQEIVKESLMQFLRLQQLGLPAKSCI